MEDGPESPCLGNHIFDFLGMVGQESDGVFPEGSGIGEWGYRAPARAFEGFFEVNFAATSLNAVDARFVGFGKDPIPRPSFPQLSWDHVNRITVECPLQVAGRPGRTDNVGFPGGFVPLFRDPYPFGVEGVNVAELDPADRSLELRHPGVGSETFVEPAEARRMLRVENHVEVLAMILKSPGTFP